MAALTEREIEVIRLMAEGLPTKSMKDAVRYTESSIETMRYNIYKKMKVKNGCQCVAVAIRTGIIQMTFFAAPCRAKTSVIGGSLGELVSHFVHNVDNFCGQLYECKF